MRYGCGQLRQHETRTLSFASRNHACVVLPHCTLPTPPLMVLIVKLPNPNRKILTQDSDSGTSTATTSQPLPSYDSTLDVLLAPRTLSHRYVRSHDRSLIVERPERIRAVLLGLSAVLGRVADKAGESASAGSSSRDGSLEEAFAKLDVKRQGGAATPRNVIQVLTSSRSLPLDPPDDAVAYVHAREGEDVEAHLPEYAGRHKSGMIGGTERIKQEAEGIEAPAPMLSHAAYLNRLCGAAPHSPPLPTILPPSDDEEETSDDEHHSEVPPQMPQGDLYLRGPRGAQHLGTSGLDRQSHEPNEGGSSDAIQHALGASVEAVDRVMAAARIRSEKNAEDRYEGQGSALMASVPDASRSTNPALRAFVLTRPPGHHCSSNVPSGFCWTNNAVVAAAHAHLRHNVRRVIILDCDLHHGNGTQAVAWRINAETLQKQLEHAGRVAALAPPSAGRRGGPRPTPPNPPEPPHTLSLFYGSVHDIESFPCEDGDPDLVRDASTCIAGAHGQWIWNVHLENHSAPNSFSKSYERTYSTLFERAREFLASVPGEASQTLIIISAGFDACEHEHPGMQRHGKSVPPSFYARFARDSIALAEEAAAGKLISLLEGGYSDWALASGAMAHVAALSDLWTSTSGQEEHEWWSVEALQHLDKLAARQAKAKPNATLPVTKNVPSWVQHSSVVFERLVTACGDWGVIPPPPPKIRRPGGVSASAPTTPLSGGRTLRDRTSLRSPKTFDPAPPRSEPKVALAGKQGGSVYASLEPTAEEKEADERTETAQPETPAAQSGAMNPLEGPNGPLTPSQTSQDSSLDHSAVSTPTPIPPIRSDQEQELAKTLASLSLQNS